MISIKEIDVRYSETDQMGVVYHANYLVWMELGRTQFIRDLGFNYAEMEKDGILSPVIDINVSYKSHFITEKQLKFKRGLIIMMACALCMDMKL